MLARLYGKGLGTPPDKIAAYAWRSVVSELTANNEHEKFAINGAKDAMNVYFASFDTASKQGAKRRAERYQQQFSRSH
jgi:hypothetical protein